MAETLHPPHIPVIGLTGSIGSGKSEAAQAFSVLGAAIIDADLLAREVVAPGTPGLTQVRKEFGDAFIDHTGALKRKALGKLVFSDPSARAKLEDILHPLIRALYLERLETARRSNPPLIVYVVPLLFESRFAYPELDAIVVVSASEPTCIARIVQRDGCTQDEAVLRYRSQMPMERKVKQSDYVLRNDGSREELATQVANLFQKLTKY